MDYSLKYLLGCFVRFTDGKALLTLSTGMTATMREDHFQRLLALFPVGKLFLNSNGRGQSYVRLKPRERGAPNNLIVARIVAGWTYGGDLAKRAVRYLDGNRLNLEPDNLSVSERGRNRASDRTHQETARREWQRKHHRPKKSQNKSGPPLRRDGEPASSPVPPNAPGVGCSEPEGAA